MEAFYKGMDLSFIPQGIDEGMIVRDFDGTVMSPLDLAEKYGVNSVRLRLWNEPGNVAEAKGYCDIAHTIVLAKEIKAHNMSFMLDFHYSDYWADPGNQTKPLAWKSLHGKELENAVYEFTRDTIRTLDGEGALPDIVQIGNEIRSGLLFPDGELPDVKGMTALINAGIRGAREAAGKERMKVMIHLDQGGRYQFIYDWFTQAFAAGLEDFDLIGLSYYAFWHGTFNDLKYTLTRLAKDFNKPLMVVETAHAWRKVENGFIDEAQEKIAGIPATPEGQKKAVDIVMNIVASIPENMGQGVYYWEPFCIPTKEGGWSANMGVLTENGTVQEAVKAFLFTRQKQCFDRITKIYEPKKQTILSGDSPILPQKVKVLYYNGELRELDAKWKVPENEAWKELGTRLIGADVESTDEKVFIEVNVVSEIIRGENLIKNADWENGLEDWNIISSDDNVAVELDSGIATVSSPMNFRFTISQTVDIKEDGVYALTVCYRGVDTTNVDIRMFIETPSQYQDQIIHPTDEDWSEHELENVKCSKGRISIGIKMAAPPVFGKIKDFYLEKRG